MVAIGDPHFQRKCAERIIDLAAASRKARAVPPARLAQTSFLLVPKSSCSKKIFGIYLTAATFSGQSVRSHYFVFLTSGEAGIQLVVLSSYRPRQRCRRLVRPNNIGILVGSALPAAFVVSAAPTPNQTESLSFYHP
jgi:hypothetical protein